MKDNFKSALYVIAFLLLTVCIFIAVPIGYLVTAFIACIITFVFCASLTASAASERELEIAKLKTDITGLENTIEAKRKEIVELTCRNIKLQSEKEIQFKKGYEAGQEDTEARWNEAIESFQNNFAPILQKKTSIPHIRYVEKIISEIRETIKKADDSVGIAGSSTYVGPKGLIKTVGL